MRPADLGKQLARAAENLVGTPFRLHGRDAATGLDCVGLLECALAQTGQGCVLPIDYQLRMRDIDRFTQRAEDFGFVAGDDPVEAGDVLLFQVGPYQFHFAIAGEEGTVVHAHAGLRRVVCSSAAADWSLVGQWRLAKQD